MFNLIDLYWLESMDLELKTIKISKLGQREKTSEILKGGSALNVGKNLMMLKAQKHIHKM